MAMLAENDAAIGIRSGISLDTRLVFCVNGRMKTLFFALMVVTTVGTSCFAQAAHWVNGYYTRNGTYIPGHYETNANGNFYDNWGTRGNYNPYTGKPGWISQSQHHPAYYDRYGVFHPAQ